MHFSWECWDDDEEAPEPGDATVYRSAAASAEKAAKEFGEQCLGIHDWDTAMPVAVRQIETNQVLRFLIKKVITYTVSKG